MSVDSFAPSSNGIPVAAEHFAPMRDSTSLLDDREALLARYRQDGYLLLRGVLDTGPIWRLREEYFSLFPASYLQEGTGPVAGVYSGHPGDLPQYGVKGHPAHSFVRGQAFAAFTGQPELASLAAAVLGQPVTLIPRKVLRHFDQAAKQSSRAHIDRAYPSGGDDMVTVWIPIGDCPVATGGLVYLSGSHRADKAVLNSRGATTDRPHDRRAYSNDLGWTADCLGGRWLWTDFRAGDVAVHGPDLVHASLDTTTAVMRLSADIRFQRAEAPVRSGWATAWAADDGE
jgi:Phytanoyl-CoA dioxygenase (PhyH)